MVWYTDYVTSNENLGQVHIWVTTPFAINLADGRPKSAPVAHWSRWFMCSLLCLMLYVVFDVPCNLCVPGCVCCICVLTWGVLVFCCGCCNGALLGIPSLNLYEAKLLTLQVS